MSDTIYKPVQNSAPEDKSKMADHQNDPLPELEAADTRCGFGLFHPRLLQPCARIEVFTMFYSFAGLITSTLTTYVTSQVTTLERQFGFTSQQTGIIMAANDIGYLACVLFVSYSASKLHIPRSLGTATILFGLSGIACSLPHFIFGAPTSGGSSEQAENFTLALSDLSRKALVFGSVCDSSNLTQDSCGSLAASRFSQTILAAPQEVAKVSLVIIFLGMMLQGFGKAPRTSLTIMYIDDNTSRVNTGFYMGIVGTLGVLGPAVAFLMGGLFSRMYVTLQPTKLTPFHPKWIGAWWLGYVLFGSLALLISLPLFCFPRRLPRRVNREDGTEGTDLTKSDDANKSEPFHKALKISTVESPEASGHQHGKTFVGRFHPKLIYKHVKDFLKTIFSLLTNPVYVCLVTSGCLLIFTLGGASSYIPKYLERMFNLPSHKANYIIAGQVLCASTVGMFSGGYMMKRLAMTAMTALKFIIAVVSVTLVCQLLGLVFQCDQPIVHNWPSEETSCNSECNCKDSSYFPVCGDGVTFYSPCHAGCGQVQNGLYQNCTCIAEGVATSGTCDYSCAHLYPYVIVMGIRSLFGSLSMVPKMVVFIRCVPHKDRALAIGFSSFLMSLLGWLLGPIVFGNIIDGICTIWDITCGVQGRCLLYDNSLFRLKIHGFGSIGILCSLICITVAYFYARRTKCLDEPKSAKGQVKEATEVFILK